MINTLDASILETKSATAASRTAAKNFAANLRSLQRTQRTLGDLSRELPADVEWLFARDGSLTALNADGKWWAGCSLPHRAAQFMLKKAELEGTVLCFLFPAHAAQLRVALDRAKAGQALLVLTPHESTLPMLLACDDFSAEIDGHRLYFAAGDQWETMLDQLLEELPGLPTPTQFIRPILADSSPADEMISPTQKIFARHSDRRATRVRTLRQEWKSTALRRICLVAPSLFRLWDNAGEALAEAMEDCPGEIAIARFNPDDPAGASSAGLAIAAAACDAIIMPNMGRGDLPDLLPDDMPCATWVTTPRIPSAGKSGPRDALLLADADWKALAVERGWKSDRLFVAGWPTMTGKIAPGGQRAATGVFEMPPRPFLTIVSDTQPLDAPARVIEYSSHRLLWESIASELWENPFAMTATADAYLSERMRQARIEDEGFDRAAFLDGVVLHAWQQGLARLLIREKLPLKLHGNGWEQLDDFRAYSAGPVRSRAQLQCVIAASTALIHTWPTPYAHPIEAAGKPVIRAGNRREAFVRDAKLALNGKYELPGNTRAALTASIVLRALTER